jgi:uncharacterized protein (DUF305 family)
MEHDDNDEYQAEDSHGGRREGGNGSSGQDSGMYLGVGASLDRSQVTVGDLNFNSAMIPHHSMAMTRAERARIKDVRVCALAVEISEARPITEFNVAADRRCPSS